MINLTFDTLGEMIAFAEKVAVLGNPEHHIIESQAPAQAAPMPVTEPAPQTPAVVVGAGALRAESVVEPEKEEPVAEEVTLEDVRAVLAPIMKSGKREAVQDLIRSFGADKLSDVEADKYSDLIKKAGEL